MNHFKRNLPTGTPRKKQPAHSSSRSALQPGQLGPKGLMGLVGRLNGLDGLSIQQKFLLIIVVAAIPALAGLGLATFQRYQSYATTQRGLTGAHYLEQVKALADTLDQVRQARLGMLLGQAGAKQSYQQAQEEWSQKLQDLIAYDQRKALSPQVTAALQTLRQTWAQGQGSGFVFATEYDSFYQEVLRAFPGLWEAIGNASGLLQDDDQDVFYLADLTAVKLPELSVSMGQSLNAALPLVLNKGGSPLEKTELGSLLAESRFKRDQTVRTRDLAVKANPRLDDSVGASAEVYFTNLLSFADRLDFTLLQSPKVNLSAASLLQTFNQTSNILAELTGRSQSDLTELLQARSKHLLSTMLAEGLLIFLGLALALWLVAVVTRRITQPLSQLYQASQRLAQGELGVQVGVQGRDELALLAQTFNQTSQQLRAKAESDAETMKQNAQLQHNIGEFLQVAMTIAQGNLTQKGRVTEDVLGNVVDAINLMTEEVGLLLKDVQKAAVQVNQGAAQMDQLTGTIFKGAQAQASETLEMRQDTTQVSQAIRQMAESAGISSKAAQQTLEAAQLGRQAVNQTLSGMSDIRSEMQGIAQNIQALSGRSAEIESIARTLEDFASQTNLLALNASFEAAGAGAAGRRFAIVAEEIRRLAEDSAKETQRVGMLVRQVQGDIGTVVAMVQEGVRQAETGYRVAGLAEERLQEIAQFSNQSSSLAEQISSLAQRQVSAVARVDQAVQKIAATAQSTAQDSLKGRQAAEIMRRLADQLAKNLGRFELP